MSYILKSAILGLSFLFFGLFAQEASSVGEIRPPNRYAFFQQKLFPSGCPIFPRLNYSLWQEYSRRKAEGNELLGDDDFIPTAWAIPYTALPLEAFCKSFNILLGQENGAFKHYYDGLLQNFVSIGKFTKKNGSPYHQVFPLRVVEKLMRIRSTPYQSYDIDEGKYIPVVQPFYQSSTGKWMKIIDVRAREVEEVKDTPFPSTGKFNGIDILFSCTDHKLTEKIPRHVGLFELVLFMNGIDRNNNPIDAEHELYPAYQNLRDVITQVEEELEAPRCHPYSQPLPDVMLESIIAKILSRNQELKDKFLITIDFCLTPWKHYQNVYHPAHPGTKAKEFMPCEDLILASYISQSARFLYAATISNEALLEVIEVENSHFIRFLQSRWAFKALPNAATMCKKAEAQQDIQIEGRSQKVSFLDAWEELVPLITESGTTAFLSFDSHGSVRVFNEENISQEFSNPTVGKRLHMHVIDSSYAKGIGSWYTRPGTEEDFLPGTTK